MSHMPRKKAPKKPGTVGANLLRIRTRAKLSQYKLAAASGIHRVTIAAIETGAHAAPDQTTVEALARALGVKPSELSDPTMGVAESAKLVDEFLSSPWGAITNATDDELDAIRRLPGVLWMEIPPTPESVHHVILAMRSNKSR